MAKDSIRDFSATASSNTDIQSVNIDENCAASGINNAIRELMADLKNVSSGAIALETPQCDSLTVSGTATANLFSGSGANLTSLPAANVTGTLAKTTMPSGAVLQVIQVTNTTQNTTSSSSMVTTGISASITPISTSNKVLILISGPIYSDTTASEPNLTIFRGSTSLTGSGYTNALSNTFNSAGRVIDSLGINFLDTPSSTSAVTYEIYFNIVGGGNVRFPVNGRTATLTLLEIAG